MDSCPWDEEQFSEMDVIDEGSRFKRGFFDDRMVERRLSARKKRRNQVLFRFEQSGRAA
jgi:hypothetical protein